ncbi:leucine--tRNA ligase [Roseivirga sp. BDSF3-8]|uniref:leucine--tRNA ligase n=1 Tax=Roseivirga sp. BDSF3-8 TaxID=3241598 RepID=UPI00353229ED
MADYHFREIEKKWQKTWAERNAYKADIDHNKPKYYVLDMFPYPSGAGLHVGHPLGYIASDIVARYKKLKGYNVLHPMGFDAFGLPAEQYAIQTGQHPAKTTYENLDRYKHQLNNIGFSFDWDKEVQTCDPDYYKWTQWIFMQLFDSWYDNKANKARPVSELTELFAAEGNSTVNAACDEDTPLFSAEEWTGFSEKEQADLLLKYRLTYLSEAVVNWCPALGTVLANDEVKDGVSERGGHPVERKKMLQWSMRITAYSQRLLDGLDTIDWPEPMKEIQRNWIGRSVGAEVDFSVEGSDRKIRVFTTRIDTIYGVTYLALAPESELVDELTADTHREEVQAYVAQAKNRSERDRMSDVKTVSGSFTGAYAIHPFSGENIPIWVADYVLGGYGTGAVMAVPAHDTRDYAFAKHFDLPIVEVVSGGNIEEEAFDGKEGTIVNSDFLNGLPVQAAIAKAIAYVEDNKIGKGKINYRQRDAVFGRQRYWGEPVPVFYVDGIPHLLPESSLPLTLPEIDRYLPTETGEPPLGRAENWKTDEGHPLELSTMPGWAGSSWYFFRYMDPRNNERFVGKQAQGYWENVDLYIGGAEHATGHLLYSRFWTMFLYDRGFVTVQEPFKKLINQGMIQGRSNFVYRVKDSNTFVSYNLTKDFDVVPMHADVSLVGENDVLDIQAFRQWRPDLADAEFVLEDGRYICGAEIEKMSKSKYNVINPDDMIDQYGADTLRMYEMFLGPLEDSKPWNTNGITGVSGFLRKFWNLFYKKREFSVTDDKPTADELKVLHKTLKKVEEDIERFSFNTTVSAFMICTNELAALKCRKRQILEPLVIALSPYAPHLAEELWQALGNSGSVLEATFPEWSEEHLKDDVHEYPISINGKMRTKIAFPVDMPKEEMEKEVLASEVVQKWTEGKPPKKVIIVPKKIVNVVV